MIHDDFLLQSPLAKRLYHDVAAPLPIIDYHCHLDPQALAGDRRFADLTELWVAGDPYKHRAMRLLGVPEADITGNASPRAKFNHWAAAVPKTLGNPLFHWTALELKRYFDIAEPLSPASADRIWHAANEKLASPEFSARSLLNRMNVQRVCTSDQPSDDLSPHRKVPIVRPSLRVDQTATPEQVQTFHAAGCRLADHAIDDLPVPSAPVKQLAPLYATLGWTLQLHLGAVRRTSSRLRGLVGPAGGYAAAGAPGDVAALAGLLDALEQQNALPRTILYPLNPADYVSLAILTGSFAQDGMAGKIQLGPAWWFNDHRLGIRQHLEALSHYGLLSTFVGFTTDSRSLLSMVRHEYFRRVLCDWIGEQVSAGLMPDDRSLLDGLVRDLCHDNAEQMLNLGETHVG